MKIAFLIHIENTYEILNSLKSNLTDKSARFCQLYESRPQFRCKSHWKVTNKMSSNDDNDASVLDIFCLDSRLLAASQRFEAPFLQELEIMIYHISLNPRTLLFYSNTCKKYNWHYCWHYSYYCSHAQKF